MLLNIADKKIGEGRPTFIIAEVGSNHDGCLKQAKRLIDEAKKAGVDCVKLQSFKAAEYLTDNHPAYDKIRKLEVPDEWHYILADYCRRKKILFTSTPFYLGAVDILEEIDVPFYKVASGDLTYSPLLKYIAKRKKPILLSTGMAYLREVKKAVNLIQGCKNKKIALLHCVANYPPQLDDINLNCLETLKKHFGLPVGLSDHTRSLAVAIGAVAKGACIIERHFTLSRKLKGPDHPFAMEPHELRDMVRAIRELETAKGSFCKRPVNSEIPERFFARRKKVKIAGKIKYLRPYK